MYHWTAKVTCPNCYTDHQQEVGEDGCASFERDWRCQGQDPDECLIEGCEECRVKCTACDLPVCEAHRQKVGTETLCDKCRLEAEAAAGAEAA